MLNDWISFEAPLCCVSRLWAGGCPGGEISLCAQLHGSFVRVAEPLFPAVSRWGLWLFHFLLVWSQWRQSTRNFCLWQILLTVTLPTYVVVKKNTMLFPLYFFVVFLGQSSKGVTYIGYEAENYAISSSAQCICVYTMLIVVNLCVIQFTD